MNTFCVVLMVEELAAVTCLVVDWNANEAMVTDHVDPSPAASSEEIVSHFVWVM